MKKLFSIILAGFMVISVAACGGNGGSKVRADKKYEGKWVSVAGEAFGFTMTGEEIEGFGIELSGGGKGSMTVDGDTTKINWSNDDEKLTLKVEGEDLVTTIGEDILVCEDMLGTGMKITFAKEGTDAANPENYIPENDKKMLGEWQSYKVSDVLGEDLSGEFAADALKMNFKGDYTVDIEFNGETISAQKWSMLDAWGTLNESDYDFSWDIVGDEIEVTYNGDDYLIFTCKK